MPTAQLEPVATLGMDIGKTSFHQIGLDQLGAIVLRQNLSHRQIATRPVNAFVASFIGSPTMNFLKGVIADGLFRSESGTMLPLAEVAPRSLPATINQPIAPAIRPERIGISFDAETRVALDMPQ
jgi:ABC-type sugar transport system ATPase subunit